MTSFHAIKCYHLVSQHEVSAARLCSSVRQFLIYSTFVASFKPVAGERACRGVQIWQGRLACLLRACVHALDLSQVSVALKHATLSICELQLIDACIPAAARIDTALRRRLDTDRLVSR